MSNRISVALKVSFALIAGMVTAQAKAGYVQFLSATPLDSDPATVTSGLFSVGGSTWVDDETFHTNLWTTGDAEGGVTGSWDISAAYHPRFRIKVKWVNTSFPAYYPTGPMGGTWHVHQAYQGSCAHQHYFGDWYGQCRYIGSCVPWAGSVSGYDALEVLQPLATPGYSASDDADGVGHGSFSFAWEGSSYVGTADVQVDLTLGLNGNISDDLSCTPHGSIDCDITLQKVGGYKLGGDQAKGGG